MAIGLDYRCRGCGCPTSMTRMCWSCADSMERERFGEQNSCCPDKSCHLCKSSKIRGQKYYAATIDDNYEETWDAYVAKISEQYSDQQKDKAEEPETPLSQHVALTFNTSTQKWVSVDAYQNPAAEVELPEIEPLHFYMNTADEQIAELKAKNKDFKEALEELRDFCIEGSKDYPDWAGWPKHFLDTVAEHCGATLDDEVEK
jgi:hypothetical protein